MSLRQQLWFSEVAGIASGSIHKSPRSLLGSSNAPSLKLRWGRPLTDTNRIDFCVALSAEMRESKLDSAGNDRLTAKELESLLPLIDSIGQIDPESQGTRGVSAKYALAAIAEVFPYLDA